MNTQPHAMPRWVKILLAIVAFKIIVILSIKAIWFNRPVVPQQGTALTEQKLLH